MKTINKYNWNYSVEKIDGKLKFKVETDDNNKVPETLFKIFSLNNNSFDALLNGYIYATHPNQFNDIFDCHEDILDFDNEEVILNFLKYGYGEEKAKHLIESNLDYAKTQTARNFKEAIYRKWGVLSLTSNPNSILMWSYYSNHAGFMLEFDYSKFPFRFQGPFPLNYQDDIKPISIKETGVELGVLLQSNLKFNGWKHENEWRILVESDEDMSSPMFDDLKKLGGLNRKFNYPIEAIKSISFGNRFFDPEELKIISDKTMEINLKSNFEQKSILLDFLSTNKIPALISEREGLMRIAYRNLIAERVNYKTYNFHVA